MNRAEAKRLRHGLSTSLVMLSLGAGLLAASALGNPRSAEVDSGGTFRIGYAGDVPAIDPAQAGPFTRGDIPSLTCVTPMNYADANRTRLIPEGAAAMPRVSRDGMTYTFTIRRGLRFNTGDAVTARTFVATVNRNLRSKGEVTHSLFDIVGAPDVLEGKAGEASGIRANGNRLTITLSNPAPDFLYRTTLLGFCAVPVGLPVDPEGLGAPFPAAGPYYVSSWAPGRRVVLRRNPRYGGRRPHHVDGFVIEMNLVPKTITTRIERGTLDLGDIAPSAHGPLGRRYGRNRSRYYVRATSLIYHAIFNQQRGAFRSVRLRRAANFAVDRTLLVRTAERSGGGERFGPNWGSPTDQWLVPRFPGYRNWRIYPLRPNVRKARALVGARAGPRRVLVYTRNEEPFLSWAQVITKNLRRIGLTATSRSFPLTVLFDKLENSAEPWDLMLLGAYGPDYPDPASVFALFEGPPTPAKYLRQLKKASTRTGTARTRAYRRVDLELARDVAPTIPFAWLDARLFVSKRVGCKLFRPELDLAAVCLKR
jgi:peptide/nickel transport system substrate-binding protein